MAVVTHADGICRTKMPFTTESRYTHSFYGCLETVINPRCNARAAPITSLRKISTFFFPESCRQQSTLYAFFLSFRFRILCPRLTFYDWIPTAWKIYILPLGMGGHFDTCPVKILPLPVPEVNFAPFESSPAGKDHAKSYLWVWQRQIVQIRTPHNAYVFIKSCSIGSDSMNPHAQLTR